MGTAFIAIGLLAAVARGDEEKKAPPEILKPGVEVEKLGYFVGEWTSSGEMKVIAGHRAGKAYTRDRCEWIAGNAFVACNLASRTPLGSTTAVLVLGWDADRKVYTWSQFESSGSVETATGTLEGGTWTWSGEAKVGGRLMKTRSILSGTAPEEYAFRREISEDGRSWSPWIESKFSKVSDKK